MELGKKILVIGISASGKSTLARQLGEKIKREVIFVDSIIWLPGWKYIGDNAFVEEIRKILNRPDWLLEGWIESSIKDEVFSAADTIIYLDHPKWVGVLQYLKRWWRHRKDARPELPDSPEKFSFKFLKLVWTKGEAISINKSLGRVNVDHKLIRLSSKKQIQEFLNNL